MNFILKLLCCFAFCASAYSSDYARQVDTVAYGEIIDGMQHVQITMSDGLEWDHYCPTKEVKHLEGIENKDLLIRNAGCIFCRMKKEMIMIVENGKGELRDFKVVLRNKQELPQIVAIQETEIEPAGWFCAPIVEFEVQLSNGTTWRIYNTRVYHRFDHAIFYGSNWYSPIKMDDSFFQHFMREWKVGDYMIISPYENGHYFSNIPEKEDEIATLAIFVLPHSS